MSQIRLRYGDFQHNLSDAAVSIRKAGEFNDAGVAYANRVVWNITGRLEGNTQAAITTAITNLENAYNKQNQSIRLQFSDGSDTAHKIDVVDTLDGIRVVAAPSYPSGEGAEYANFRNYAITVEALVKTNQNNSNIVFWQERVEMSGGQPRDVVVETLNSAPIIQRIADQTAFIVSQAGRVVALNGWHTAAPWLLPQAAVLQNRIANRSPRTVFVGGATYKSMFETTWSYVFGWHTPGNIFPSGRPLI